MKPADMRKEMRPGDCITVSAREERAYRSAAIEQSLEIEWQESNAGVITGVLVRKCRNSNRNDVGMLA